MSRIDCDGYTYIYTYIHTYIHTYIQTRNDNASRLVASPFGSAITLHFVAKNFPYKHAYTGRWRGVRREERICENCRGGEVEDVGHLVMRCTYVEEEKGEVGGANE